MKVVSFFSGLGGLDKGFVDTGYDIIWANDFDKYAVQTYKANFGDHIVLGDINEIPLEIIPDCDILIGGFPCQPFSMMGQQKGFEDTRGTLFFRIAEIVDDKIKRGKRNDNLNEFPFMPRAPAEHEEKLSALPLLLPKATPVQLPALPEVFAWGADLHIHQSPEPGKLTDDQ